jgi:hypothetical protein
LPLRDRYPSPAPRIRACDRQHRRGVADDAVERWLWPGAAYDALFPEFVEAFLR